MISQNFTFEALLAVSKKRLTKKEIKTNLEFIKNFTLEINEIDLSKLKHGGTILN